MDALRIQRMVTRCRVPDAAMAGGGQAQHEVEDRRRVIGVDDVEAGLSVALEHRDGRDAARDHGDGGLGERVDEDRAAPVVAADLAHHDLPARVGVEVRRRLVAHVHVHALDVGARLDALQLLQRDGADLRHRRDVGQIHQPADHDLANRSANLSRVRRRGRRVKAGGDDAIDDVGKSRQRGIDSFLRH